MMRTVALGAFLFALSGSMTSADTKPTRADVQAAFRQTVENLAGMRVEQQNCVGDVTSAVRDTTDMILNWGETFNMMPRAAVIDLVNDQQIYFRQLMGTRCENNGSRRELFLESADKFLKLNRQLIENP